jgi:hypothetical protein
MERIVALLMISILPCDDISFFMLSERDRRVKKVPDRKNRRFQRLCVELNLLESM